MKKQWQQWIRIRSRTHGAHAKNGNQLAADNVYKKDWQKAQLTGLQEAGPIRQSSPEQTYFKSFVQSSTDRLSMLKQDHLETRNHKHKTMAEDAVKRIAEVIPISLRKSAISCQQAYRIVSCLAYFQTNKYSANFIESLLDIILSKSYSVPANRVSRILLATAKLRQCKVNDFFLQFAPRLTHVVDELTSKEISKILAAYGRSCDTQNNLHTLFEVFVDIRNELTFIDCADALFAARQMRLENIAWIAEILIERAAHTLTIALHTKENVEYEHIVRVLEASAFFGVQSAQFYSSCMRIISCAIDQIQTNTLVDAWCALRQSIVADSDEVFHITQVLQQRAKVKSCPISRPRIAVFWIHNELISFEQIELSRLIEDRVVQNMSHLTVLELAECIFALVDILILRLANTDADKYCLSSTLFRILDTLLGIKQAELEKAHAISCMNLLAAMAKFDTVLKKAYPGSYLLSECLEKRKNFVNQLLQKSMVDRKQVERSFSGSTRSSQKDILGYAFLHTDLREKPSLEAYTSINDYFVSNKMA